ncbi:MAG: phytanoyl-CoA dioxygenase family protein [Armatimonadota bacterium]
MSQHDWQVVSRATPEQVAFYKEHGYLKFGRIFTREELDTLREHVDQMIASLPPGKRPEELDVPHFEDAWLFRYLAHPRVLDVIECFLGPDIVLWSSHFIAKPGGDGKAVPWHTDGDYWGNRLEPMEVITLWLAVDESTRENGCMRVIPGSHRWQHPGREAYRPVDTTTHVFSTELQNVDESQAVDIELAIGECSFHDAWTVHASAPNHSSKRRCGYTMRYMPAYVVHKDTSSGHRIYLLRGKDRTGGKNIYTPVPEL